MGTSAVVTFIETRKKDNVPYVNIQHHWDGYIDGVGHSLAKWLCKKKMVNGLPLDIDKHMANGVGCLAAQYIHKVKKEPGDVYIAPLDCKGEYNYKVIIKDSISLDSISPPCPLNEITEILVTDIDGNIIFQGSPKELLEFKEY